MPRKGMKTLCFHAKTPSLLAGPSSSPQRSNATPASTPPRRSVTESMVEQIIESAAVLVMKWDPESSTYAKVTSLFYESKAEARQFIMCVGDLQKAMHFMVSDEFYASSQKLVLAQSLMQIAMKRLQKEFYQILSMNRAYLDPESVSTRSSRASARSSVSEFEDDGGTTTDDDIRVAGDSISEVEQVSSTAMEDLRVIAECMISAGYAIECINIYKIIRKSIIDEGIYRMGVEKLSHSQINKYNSEVLEFRVNNWLQAVKKAKRTLFNGERILCDHVFSSSDPIRESCFSDISREGALLLFGFPELIAKSKRSPEKIFPILGMYTAIFENWPEIESIFGFESTAAVRSAAFNSLVRMAEFVREALSDFESAIQKDNLHHLLRHQDRQDLKKSPPGGGLHRLTVHVMNHLSLLADYSEILVDIFRDWPPPAKYTSSLPETLLFDNSSSADSSDESHPPPSPLRSPASSATTVAAISLRLGLLILVLLCKLDGKSKHYDDVSVSYLFLANNLNHVVSKVRTSNLHYLLGDEWVAKHEAKVRQFTASYERLAWGKVYASLPENPTTAAMSAEQAKIVFKNFNSSFEEACKKQRSSVVPDVKLRDEIKTRVFRKLVTVYREFYDTHRITLENERQVRLFVKFTPEDVGNYLSDMFFGTSESESCSSSCSSSPSSSSHRRQWRVL
ncbi:exocyst complex component EXO70H1-like [Morus notabilis]|uniref:exocyst complex component EXO70H1-like n=1 Tax=Morus notabilis TaxID=981085 RepID=UPI000CECE3D2|nr:exocyst complex component EXO70H1-like [Morus notabilis]